MTIVAGLEAVALVAVVWCFLRHIQAIQAQAAVERSELASRIQHPERIIATSSEPVTLPDREPDDWNQVGQITITKEWLEADD